MTIRKVTSTTRLLMLGGLVSLPASSVLANIALSESEDQMNTGFIEIWQDGKLDKIGRSEVGKPVTARILPKDEKPPRTRPEERVHPLVQRWMREYDPGKRVEVVISMEEFTEIPRFPEPDIDKDRDAAVNQKALARAGELVATLQQRRQAVYKEMEGWLQGLESKVLDSFWLVPALSVSVHVGNLERLLENKAIIYVEPVQTDDLPPANGNPDDDVDDARRLIQSDPYFNQGLTSGWIGLLDSGVHRTHQLLAGPGRIALWRDCTSGAASCTGGNPDDTCWNHGTSAAAIISGNNNQGNPQRGVTGIFVDSWKVYPDAVNGAGNCTGGLNTTATVRAFEQAVRWLDRVIVAEMQGSGGFRSTVSRAADAAFDAGSAVIAANGNNGSAAGTVNAPANAHKVLGIGAYDTQSGSQYGNQSRGPTTDNRFKPDIQMPNNSETASTGCGFGNPCAPLSNTANRVFGGTSGAVPYGGAAAALARNWMRRVGQTDPGHVYARLINAGQNPYPFDNTQGAGRAKLPVNGYSWWGKVSVGDGDVIEIPLNVTRASAHDLDGALWWPERRSRHNDIDLYLVAPNGAVMDSSISIPSVFERARAAGNVVAGTWKLRIKGYRVRGGRQTVYYNATVRN